MKDKNKNLYSTIFIIALMSFGGIYILGNFICNGIFFKNIFFELEKDSALDFYVFLKNSGRDSYSVGHGINPPLVKIIMRIFYKSLPIEVQEIFSQSAISNTEIDIRTVASAQMSYLMFEILTVAFIFLLLYKYKIGSAIQKTFFSFVSITSIGFFYAYERGNIIILSVLFLLIFVIFLDSEKKIYRLISSICLALSAGIKLYPVLYGLVLLKKDKKKQMFVSILCGFLVILLPFAFLGGLDGIIGMNKGLSSNNESGIKPGYLNLTSIIMTVLMFCGKTELSPKHIFILRILVYIFCFCLMCFSIMFKEKWKKYLAITLAMFSITGTSHMYMLSFMIIPIIEFFNQSEHKRAHIFYLICFIGTMAIIPGFTPSFLIQYRIYNYRLTYIMVLHELFLLLLNIAVFIEGLSVLKNAIKDGKKITKKGYADL